MDKYNAQEPRTVNTINNGNITLLYVYYNNTIIQGVSKKTKIIEITYCSNFNAVTQRILTG